MKQKRQWFVHAFHGNSCLTVEGSRALVDIRTQTDGRCVFTVSPVTQSDGSSLSDLLDLASTRNDGLWKRFESVRKQRHVLIGELVDGGKKDVLQKKMKQGFSEIEELLKAVWLVGEHSEAAEKFIDAVELSWFLESLELRLHSEGFFPVIAESAQLFYGRVEDHILQVDYEHTASALQEFITEHADADTILVAGGWFSNRQGRLIETMNRSGELLAAVCGNLLDAEQITFWNENDFVTTADPELVPGAAVVSSLTYAEATELSYFGADILHPQTFVPAMAKGIPIIIRNVADPVQPGTLIASTPSKDPLSLVKGFSVIKKAALVNIEGAGMIGVPGISSRLFTALREHSISVILISQASSEHSICFAVPEKDAELAGMVSKKVFADELEDYRIQSIEVETDCAILAAVGEQMPGTYGIAAKFFGALGKAHINVRAIAQGSSERNISAVIKRSDATRALRALHAGFFLSNQTLSIGLFGPGLIGSTLLGQISRERDRLRSEFNVDLRIRGIANSTKMLLNDQGIDLGGWRDSFDNQSEPIDLKRFVDHVGADYFPHTVLIDCSTSQELPQHYTQWIERGIHIITPNKKAGTAPDAIYQEMMAVGRKRSKHFLYETTVGAGLPIIGTLKDLIQTGDRIRRIEGVFSGTLAYLFWRFDGSAPFSELVREAKSLGYTEPDPRDDLSGMDIVRKAVILSREIGMKVEVEDVPVLNLVPEDLRDVSIDEFMQHLDCIDQRLDQMREEADAKGELLKYVGVIDPEEHTCKVELRGYPTDHPFARISGTDNIVAFTTDRYQQQPLVIQGPGAGPEVTAGGVFADLLRLSSFLGARF
jgi:aspartokinase/homoserine dehydrogenase 1